MLGDTHADALQNRDDGLDRLVHDEPCRPSFQIEWDEAKFPDGYRRFLTAVLVGYMWDVAYLLY